MEALLLSALSALITWGACRWWYGRRLRRLREQLERRMPTVPSSATAFPKRPTPPGPPPSDAAQALELLERNLKESEGEWATARPFLDTSPLTRDPRQQAAEHRDGSRPSSPRSD